jgi:hypothetical protein
MFIESQVMNVAFSLRAGPCRPGLAGATRPGSDFFHDIIYLRLNSPGTRAGRMPLDFLRFFSII